MSAAAEKPFHFTGNFAPVEREVTAVDLRVEGALPPELTGLYVRQAPNPKTEDSPHWFLGDGMLHGVRLERGRAVWYRNRWVQTPYLANPDVQRISERGVIDRTVSKANTHVIRHAGRILALEEGSFPYVVDARLETLGWTDFDGKLRSAFTAHPKHCPVTGELIAFGYGQLPPYLVYLRISADGRLVQSDEIQVGGSTMMHDFAITTRHALFLDLPVVFSLEDALKGTMPYSWSDDYPARIGVMPRDGTDRDVRWFAVEPCFIFHTLNAYEDGNTVVLDACRYSEMWRKAGDMQTDTDKLKLHRYRFDLASGAVKEETLDDRPLEFPRVADAVVGRKHRFGYALALERGRSESPGFAGILKWDLESGRSELHDCGPGRTAGEVVFVPARGADPRSDEGYLLTYVHDAATNQSELWVLDASRMTSRPLARVALPQRVPNGFHGSWLADA
jgi:carotenoid cleavage dioxygenase